MEGEKQFIRRYYHQQEREKNNSLFLLLSMLPLLILYPVLTGELIFSLFITFILCTGVFIFRGKRHSFLLSCILAIVSLEIIWTSLFSGGTLFRAWGEFFAALLIVQVTMAVLQDFIRSTLRVEDLLLSALALVLSSVILFGLGYHLLDLQNASSFHSALDYDPMTALPACLFFSTSTLVPIGSGAVYPASPMTMILTGVEMIWGFLLLALITARLAATWIKKERDESIVELCQ
jgi:hypothetical protein